MKMKMISGAVPGIIGVSQELTLDNPGTHRTQFNRNSVLRQVQIDLVMVGVGGVSSSTI